MSTRKAIIVAAVVFVVVLSLLAWDGAAEVYRLG